MKVGHPVILGRFGIVGILIVGILASIAFYGFIAYLIANPEIIGSWVGRIINAAQ